MPAHVHACHGTPENTFSSLFAKDPRQNLITKKIQHSGVIVELHIHCPVVARSAQPGQFVIVRGNEKGERVPLTIADYDRESGELVLVLQIVGLASHKLDEMREGDRILDIVGPLGCASDIVTGAATVIEAMGAGKKAATAIDQYLRNR